MAMNALGEYAFGGAVILGIELVGYFVLAHVGFRARHANSTIAVLTLVEVTHFVAVVLTVVGLVA